MATTHDADSEPDRTDRPLPGHWTCRQCERTYAVPPRRCRHCSGTTFTPA